MNSVNINLATETGSGLATAVCRQHLSRIMEIVHAGGDTEHAGLEVKHDPVLLYQYMTHLRANGVGYQHDSASHAIIRFHQQEFSAWLGTLAEVQLPDASLPISKNAVVRGRFLELLGRSIFGEAKSDELFVAGIFSVLDILLARPMRSLLDQISVSEDMYQALLYRKGPYASLLFLAKAIEDANEQRIDQLQAALQIPIEAIYETYNAALEWAEGK
jgi:EAL and modified HD-GYP domain-containing signal transduction protein